MQRIKRTFALLLVLSALLAAVPVQAASGEYWDVPRTHWAYSSIKTASRSGVVQGLAAKWFGVGEPMSRASYATALCRLMGWETVTPAKGSFADNQDTKQWYFSAMETAYANGAVTKQSTLCRPNDAITREEMAVMTVRALNLAGLSGLVQEDCPFSDVSANQGYVTLAYRLGLVTGVNAFNFAPQRALTREEAAVVLARTLTRRGMSAALSESAAPASAVRVKSITGTDGAVPISPRAPLEEVYRAAVNGGAVVLHTTPLRQTVKNGKADAGEEISKAEVVALIQNGAEVHRSTRYESSYLLYQEGGKTYVVWFESDADIAQKVSLCAMLGVKTVYIER